MSKVPVYTFTEEVQDDILRLMTHDMMFSQAASFWVKPHYFKREEQIWLATLILNFSEKYGVTPTASQASTEAIQQAQEGRITKTLVQSLTKFIPSIFKQPVSGAKTYTLELVQKFARYKAWEEAIVQALPYHQRGEIEEVDRIMMEAQYKSCDMDTDFYWYMESAEERIRRRGTDDELLALPTGILELDIHFRRGGVLPGEVALWMAPKGRGKCLSYDTLVGTPNGDVPIGKIVSSAKEGWKDLDKPYMVYDMNGTIRTVTRGFCNGLSRTKKIILDDGRQIEGSLEHPLYVFRDNHWQWVEMALLQPQDSVAVSKYRGLWEPVAIKDIQDNECMTFDIEVPVSHSFIANKIVSHNSIGLSHVTRRAILEGLKVAYYSFEMSKEQNADRLDAGFSGVSMWSLENEQERLYENLNALKARFPKSLGIKQYPTKGRTIQDIRRHLETVNAVHKWSPNVLVLDYITIVKPPRSRNGRHEEMQEALEEFRALCVDLGCIGWTAAQINRSGARKEISDGTDAAGSWDQLATADHIFTLNQTREERARNEIRIFIDKCRDGHSEIEIKPLYTDWERMCFVKKSNKTLQEVRQEFQQRMNVIETKAENK